MRIKYCGYIIFLMLCIVGCDSNKQLNKKFKNNKHIIFIEEETGDRYIIEHNLGNNYFLTLFKEKN